MQVYIKRKEVHIKCREAETFRSETSECDKAEWSSEIVKYQKKIKIKSRW